MEKTPESKKHTMLRPDSFAAYSAMSALRNNASAVAPSCGASATPMLARKAEQARSLDELARNALFNAYFGGNTRVRAQQTTGDAWAEDPGCYLSDEEIGL